MQTSQLSKSQKIKKLFGADNLSEYFQNLVNFLVMLHLPDLNNINANNQFNSTQQQQQFYRNVATQNYHTNVITEMSKAITASKLFYNKFKDFVFTTIQDNSKISRINLQNKHQYTSVEKNNIYTKMIEDVKEELLKKDININFFYSVKQLLIKCNLLFSDRRYPKYMLPLVCKKLVNGTLEVPLPYSKFLQLKEQIRNQI